MQPLYHTFAEMTNNKLYRIPDYQRAYSWTLKQRKDLFEDIEKIALVPGGDRHHFMATIVVLKTGESQTVGSDKYEILDVVDGQQRLTTLIMLLKAIAGLLT